MSATQALLETSLEPLLDDGFLAGLAHDIGADGAVEATRIFAEDAPGRMARMREAAVVNTAVARREAHALAGSARAVGLRRLGEAAGAMQRALENGRADQAALPRLEPLLRQSLAALAAWQAAQPAFT